MMRRALPGLAVALALACLLSRPVQADDARLWRGNFLVGRPGAVFSPCRSAERYQIDDATTGKALEQAYRELARQPGRAIFVEFVGVRMAHGIRATRFERALTDGPGCGEDLSAVRMRAYGFNPFIQIEVRAAKIYLRLRPAGAPEIYTGGALEVDHGEARLEATRADSVLKLRVRARPCREPLSNGLFSYEAIADVHGTPYTACAYWGDLGPIPELPRESR
jgi:uncharacterized membrane protein